MISSEVRRKIAEGVRASWAKPECCERHLQAVAEANHRRDITPEYRARLAQAKLGKKRPPFTPEARHNMSEAHKGRSSGMLGKRHSMETRAQQSETHHQAWVRGERQQYGGAKRVKYGTIVFRSSWEAKLAQWLDVHDITWLYEPQRFVLGKTSYVPDFYLPSYGKWIEVKGRMRPEALIKIAAFKALWYDLEVLKEQELRQLRII